MIWLTLLNIIFYILLWIKLVFIFEKYDFGSCLLYLYLKKKFIFKICIKIINSDIKIVLVSGIYQHFLAVNKD